MTPAISGGRAADFGLPLNRKVRKVSRGMRPALGIMIGLAARAEVTLFGEPYAGLDAVARQVFYDRLIDDYARHPRTVLLSTHLIDEAAGLRERVVVLDAGRAVLDAAGDAKGSSDQRCDFRRRSSCGRPASLISRTYPRTCTRWLLRPAG